MFGLIKQTFIVLVLELLGFSVNGKRYFKENKKDYKRSLINDAENNQKKTNKN